MRLLLITTFTTLFISCNFMDDRIRGNGDITTREEEMGPFNSIDIRGAVKVYITQAQDYSVNIETDRNLMEFLDVSVIGNTLVVGTRKGYNLRPSKGIVAHISAPKFNKINVSGASEIIGENALTGDNVHISASGASKIILELSGNRLVTDLSGASTLILKGDVKDFDLEAGGASDINCFDLVTENARVDLSGASTVNLTVNKSLHAEASGASNVNYKGSASVNSKSSGAGTIKKVD